ncbi:hypothetical protein SAMN05444156_2323 [Verrucomicrobium sp. GAS474]|nr:hypothetical protein SAMN05444156_2323 [Verrucomicrobium sp. GAS474]
MVAWGTLSHHWAVMAFGPWFAAVFIVIQQPLWQRLLTPPEATGGDNGGDGGTPPTAPSPAPSHGAAMEVRAAILADHASASKPKRKTICGKRVSLWPTSLEVGRN